MKPLMRPEPIGFGKACAITHYALKRVGCFDLAEGALSLPIGLGSAEHYGMISHLELECGQWLFLRGRSGDE